MLDMGHDEIWDPVMKKWVQCALNVHITVFDALLKEWVLSASVRKLTGTRCLMENRSLEIFRSLLPNVTQTAKLSFLHMLGDGNCALFCLLKAAHAEFLESTTPLAFKNMNHFELRASIIKELLGPRMHVYRDAFLFARAKTSLFQGFKKYIRHVEKMSNDKEWLTWLELLAAQVLMGRLVSRLLCWL